VQAQSSYETPPILKVGDLAPAGLIVGQGYRVAERVPTTGLLGEFKEGRDAHARIGGRCTHPELWR